MREKFKKQSEVMTVKKAIVLFVYVAILSSAVGLSAAPDEEQDRTDVLQTMDRMGQAMVNKDIPTLTRVLHEDLTWGHATGDTQTKPEMLKTVAGPEVWEVFKFSRASIHFYGSTAVVRCVADIRNGTPPKNPVHDGHFNMLLVLVKGQQGWQIVGEQRVHLDEKAHGGS